MIFLAWPILLAQVVWEKTKELWRWAAAVALLAWIFVIVYAVLK
jgi:hypothetical protein